MEKVDLERPFYPILHLLRLLIIYRIDPSFYNVKARGED